MRKIGFLRAVLPPLVVLMGIFIASFCYQMIVHRFPSLDVFPLAIPVRNAGSVICFVWCLLRCKKWLYEILSKRLENTSLTIDRSSLEMSGKILNIIIFFFTFLVVLQIFGFDVVPFVAFGGIGAAAIGFAAKDLIGNYVSGFMLYATRPFSIQDLVELPDKNISGYVEEIGWCVTSLRDLNKRLIFIPNALFSSAFLINVSRMSHRCIHETLHIQFKDVSKILNIVQSIKAYFALYSKIDKKQPIYVYLKTFGSYSLEIEIRAYINSMPLEEFMVIKQEILLEIHQIITNHSAEIAFPTTTMKTDTALDKMVPQDLGV